jgi:serine/threonine-protein kinase PknG
VICGRDGCTGTILDGYCDVCGMAAQSAASAPVASVASEPIADPSAPTRSILSSSATTQARRSNTSRSAGMVRGGLGAGLVEVPAVPYRDPSSAIMQEPTVVESRRFCARCGEPVGRGREDAAGRSEGFCRKCGAPFSFAPKLAAGDVVAGQYEVVGCLAHGGMGWVYLARDHNVSDRWVVLKGLLNTGDDDAMAAALAERRFLAEVEHPNIVKIFNFVQHQHSGYIVMEYVGGKSLKELRAEKREDEAQPAPLPPSQAIAYMLAILPALGHLHSSGLLFCDFKLDNVIRTQDSLKLIDLGGVYRLDDAASPVYGTVGYQAPEISRKGPSVSSDLYTVARTLALLCIDFKGYQGTFQSTLPPPDTVPLFQEHDSLYRLLLKATAPNPDDRFQSAEEMADQLLGVLREVVARESGKPVPGSSSLFTGDFRGRTDEPDWRLLPALQVDTDDPAAGYLATLAATDPDELVRLLRDAPDRTVEVDLRLARALIEAGDLSGADEVIKRIEEEDPWEWRAEWCRGLAELARDRANAAVLCFRGVYQTVPGELAPKLALGVAAEAAAAPEVAISWYDIVSRTDGSYTTATFGLARCCLVRGDRAGALAAYERVDGSSSAHADAQIARIHCLTAADNGAPTPIGDLVSADAALRGLQLDGEHRARLTVELIEAALGWLDREGPTAGSGTHLAGYPVVERDLRAGLEHSYRELARMASSTGERIRLVDAANRVRPRTWT